MNNSSLRQKYLSLVARLYELAAEFSDSELRSIHDNFVKKDEHGIEKAISALISLHGGTPHGAAARNYKIAHEHVIPTNSRAPHADILNEKSLGELLGDKDLFPNLNDIARIVPRGLPLQNKEGRGRYIGRVIRHITTLSESEREIFRTALSLELEKRPTNFVSRWKNLIREL